MADQFEEWKEYVMIALVTYLDLPKLVVAVESYEFVVHYS